MSIDKILCPPLRNYRLPEHVRSASSLRHFREPQITFISAITGKESVPIQCVKSLSSLKSDYVMAQHRARETINRFVCSFAKRSWILKLLFISNLDRKRAMLLSLNIPPHMKRPAALPCDFLSVTFTRWVLLLAGPDNTKLGLIPQQWRRVN